MEFRVYGDSTIGWGIKWKRKWRLEWKLASVIPDLSIKCRSMSSPSISVFRILDTTHDRRWLLDFRKSCIKQDHLTGAYGGGLEFWVVRLKF